jgi:lysophospholipase L1-like esterase
MDRRWVLGGLLVAGGLGLVRALTSRPKIHPDGRTRLMLIGDSHAEGLNPHLKALATDQKVPYLSGAKRGTRIDQWATSQWLTDNLAAFQPTLVLVVLGTNDAYAGPDVWGKEQSAYEALLHQLKTFSNVHANGEDPSEPLFALGAEVVWVGPPVLPDPYNGMAIDRAFLDQLALSAPHYFHSEELSIPKGPDGLHPTASGYAGWAGALWQWLT